MGNEKLEINNDYSTELFDFNPESWTQIKDDILGIEGLCFVVGLAYTENLFAADFSQPRATIILLRDPSKKIIGYTYALPINADKPEREEEKDETAIVDSTAIDPQYQGKGLVGKLIGELEKELIRKGFRFMERDAAIPNGYADTVQRHYGDRVIESRDHDSKYGPQRFFRIKL